MTKINEIANDLIREGSPHHHQQQHHHNIAIAFKTNKTRVSSFEFETSLKKIYRLSFGRTYSSMSSTEDFQKEFSFTITENSWDHFVLKTKNKNNMFQIQPFMDLVKPRLIPADFINTTQKMKFPIQDFFSKCDQIHSFLRIWSHLLKKCLMKNFVFCEKKVIGFGKSWQVMSL